MHTEAGSYQTLSFAWGADFGKHMFAKFGPPWGIIFGKGRPRSVCPEGLILAAKIGPWGPLLATFLPKSVQGNQFGGGGAILV